MMPIAATPAPVRRPALDGLRGIAVVAVVLYHGPFPSSGGFLGVDLFFVLSGYLITGLLLKEHAKSGKIHYADFLRRRLKRLLPALTMVIVAQLIYVWSSAEAYQVEARRNELLASMGYVANWYFIATGTSYFDHNAGVSALRHVWSLSIEEQFYVFWPLVLSLLFRLRSQRPMVWVTVLLVGASILAQAAYYDELDPSRSYFGTDSRAHQPLLGALLAMWSHQRPRPESRVSTSAYRLAQLSILPAGAALLFASDRAASYYSGGSLAFSMLCIVLIAGVERGASLPIARFLESRALVWLGTISYGLYLWHWPIKVWYTARFARALTSRDHLVVLTISVTVAWLSFVLIERPIREGRGRVARKIAHAPLRSSLIAIVASLVLIAAATRRNDPISDAARDLSSIGCPGQRANEFAHCALVDPPTPRLRLATIGDSTAGALSPGLRALASAAGWQFIQATYGGCSMTGLPFAAARRGHFSDVEALCTRIIAPGIRHLLTAARPDLVIATERLHLTTLHRDNVVLEAGDPGHLTAYRAQLERVADEVNAAGARLVFVETVPMGPPVSCGHDREAAHCARMASDDERTNLYNSVLRDIASLRPDRVFVVSIADVVCPDGRCTVFDRDGTMIRYDGVHYTGTFSRKVASELVARLKGLGLLEPKPL